MSEPTKTNRIEDAGEFIAGARKDWHLNAMTRTDVDNMTNEEVVIHVKKDNVWPKPDFEKLIEGGMSPMTAALIKVIRDQIAQQPRALAGINPMEGRKTFVDLLNFVKEIAEQCKTPEDVEGLLSRYYAHAKEHCSGNERFLIYKGRTNPLSLGYKERQAAKGMLDVGWPSKENDWKRNMRVVQGYSGFTLLRSKTVLKSGFESEDAAWAWAKENTSKKPAAKKTDVKIEPKRPHLDRLEREGLSFDREDRHISAEDFLETFGFRGVQFGNWLPNGERQQVLNLGYEALMDLAEVLGWEPKALSLDGTLGIAFGSRGAGRYAAHYEPGQRVINMTKISGAGSLAHEFAHALDHWLGTNTPVQVPGGIPSATGWHHLVDTSAKLMPHRDQSITKSCDDTMKSMLTRPLTKDEALERLNTSRSKYEAEISKHEEAVARIKNKGLERINKKYLKEVEPYITGQKSRLAFVESSIASINSGSLVDFGKGQTDYYKEAQKLCGSSDYYRRPNELFARAFESWVFDEIHSRGAVSDYLVHSVEEDRFAGDEYKGNLYPVGDERKTINTNMRAIADSVKPEVELNLDANSGLRL